MATAVEFRFNGGEGQVVRDADHALRHIAHNLFRVDGGQAVDVDKAIAAETGAYDYLAPAGAVPHLAGMLHREARAQNRETVEIVVHDLDAKPGFTGVRLHHCLVDDDPTYALLDALVDVAENESPVEEAEDLLLRGVERGIEGATRFLGTPEDALAALRARADLVGPPHGHPLRIVPDAVPGEDAATVLGGMKATALARFRDIVAKCDLDPEASAPTP